MEIKDRDHLSNFLLNLLPAISNSVGYYNFLFGKLDVQDDTIMLVLDEI